MQFQYFDSLCVCTFLGPFNLICNIFFDNCWIQICSFWSFFMLSLWALRIHVIICSNAWNGVICRSTDTLRHYLLNFGSSLIFLLRLTSNSIPQFVIIEKSKRNLLKNEWDYGGTLQSWTCFLCISVLLAFKCHTNISWPSFFPNSSRRWLKLYKI